MLGSVVSGGLTIPSLNGLTVQNQQLEICYGITVKNLKSQREIIFTAQNILIQNALAT